MAKKTIADVNVQDKRVLVRVDFNVPMIDESLLMTKNQGRAAHDSASG